MTDRSNIVSRPLSPHLFIYRFGYTMAFSILHRGTGVALSLGLLLLVGWVAALALGADSYAAFARFAASWPVKAVLGAMVVSFVYHLVNGVRHLCWDLGWGMERHQARSSAKVVFVLVILVSAALLYYFFWQGAAG
jgi:succinate dehydrogenase / fumarate reductase, cytochrome b subunit